MLAEVTFDTIVISEDVIRFYGRHIEENAKESLCIFPFDFGHHYMLPGFMTAENYLNMESAGVEIPE